MASTPEGRFVGHPMGGIFLGGNVLAARSFLALNALIWVPYGAYCFFVPGFLESAAGVLYATPTGATEVRAMYGGLQMAIGALCALGALRSSWESRAICALGVLTLGLGSSRLLGAFLDSSFSSYTLGAIVFEFALAGSAFWLDRRAVTD